MSDETLALLALSAVLMIGTVAAVTSIVRERARQLRQLAFADGYREGWRDNRDGRPPRDLP